MRTIVKIMSICAFALFLAGCPGKGGKDSPDGTDVAQTQAKKRKARFPVDDLAPTTVVIRVNGQPITQADYANWYRLRFKIYKVTNRIPPTEKSDRTRSFSHDNRARLPAELVRRELMRQEAERLGIEVPDARLRKMEQAFMKSIRSGKKPFSAIDELFGRDAEFLRKTISLDTRDSLCVEKCATNSLTKVTDEELDAQIKWVKDWNARADATNKVQLARAWAARRLSISAF